MPHFAVHRDPIEIPPVVEEFKPDDALVYWLTRRDIRRCLEEYLDTKDEGDVPHAPVTEEQLDEVIDRFTDCDMSERPSWLDVVETYYKELYKD